MEALRHWPCHLRRYRLFYFPCPEIYLVDSDSPIRTNLMGLLCGGRVACSLRFILAVRERLACLLPDLFFLAKYFILYHTHMVDSFTGYSLCTIPYSIGCIFFTGFLRRLNAMLCFLLCPDIGILHSLSRKEASVNGFYGSLNHIPCLDLRHGNAPYVSQTDPHRVLW